MVQGGVMDLMGVQKLVAAERKSRLGGAFVFWDGRDNLGKEVTSGIYFCVLSAGERREGKKMLLIK